MRWLAFVVELFSVAYGTRSTLKHLRILTENREENDPCRKVSALHDSRDTLMFWSLFGLYKVFCGYGEFLIQWLPGYYYLKCVALLLVTFPRLKFTQTAFESGVVPLLDRCHAELEARGGLLPTVTTALYDLPFLVMDLLFPFSREPHKQFASPYNLEDLDRLALDRIINLSQESLTGKDMPASPILPPRPPADFSRMHTPIESRTAPLSRAESLRAAVGESARRLTRLAQMPTPRGLNPRYAWNDNSSSSDSDDEHAESKTRVFDLMDGVDISASPDTDTFVWSSDQPETLLSQSNLPSPPAYSQQRGTFRRLSSNENALPNISYAESAPIVKSVTALFSLDVHSPPLSSTLRRRSLRPLPLMVDRSRQHMNNRQSAGAALGRNLPPLDELLSRSLSSTNAPNRRRSSLKQSVTSTPTLDDALLNGHVNIGRRRDEHR